MVENIVRESDMSAWLVPRARIDVSNRIPIDAATIARDHHHENGACTIPPDRWSIDPCSEFANYFDTSLRDLAGQLDSPMFATWEVRKLQTDSDWLRTIRRLGIVLERPDTIQGSWSATVRFPLQFGSRDTLAVGAVSFPVVEWLRLENALLSSRPASAIRPEWVRDLRALLEQHFRDRLRIRHLASRFDRTYNHVGRMFAERLGVTVSQYVRARRVAWAAERMGGVHGTIVDIALQAGFCDQSHMTREFRTFAGSTPAELGKLRARIDSRDYRNSPVPTDCTRPAPAILGPCRFSKSPFLCIQGANC
jgi:AraC-like DNA-binding protein